MYTCIRKEVFAFLERGLILDQNAVEGLRVGHIENRFL